MSPDEAQKLVAQRPWWYHRFEIFPGVVTPGVYDPSGTLSMLGLPADLTGLTILEVGPAEGYFTKTLAARGADITAVDYIPKDYHGFGMMEQLSGRSFKFHQSNVYDLPKHNFGKFDVVLCLGVLYHLPDPFRALWTLRQNVKRTLILETLVSREVEDAPMARYLPADSTNGDITNFWAPNVLCTQMMLQDAGFIVDKTWINGTRAMFHCSLNEQPGALSKAKAAYDQPDWT